MEVMIHEMESTVRAVDGEALLHPSILKTIIDLAIAKITEHQHHERVVKEERQMKPAVTSREISFWE
jgi:hypothetical protein